MNEFQELNENASEQFHFIGVNHKEQMIHLKNERLKMVAAYHKLFSLFHSVLYQDRTGRFTHKRIKAVKKYYENDDVIEVKVPGIEIETSNGWVCSVVPDEKVRSIGVCFHMKKNSITTDGINNCFDVYYRDNQWHITVRIGIHVTGVLEPSGIKHILNNIFNVG
ncbi:hypothetical protein PC510_003812 [Escherichia coli]|uniref:hypothetical protein n=1 Tax=Escherichia coli TaxID=562 RepID=UPI0017D60E74|nr:hypothetical protein [Escherichia coli]EKI3096538.1 hypothetical protein [Escherichia coli]MBB9841037.1 hypothetical protein [Escherichia coli]MBS9328463.1 hypothetical protein [Escherichia coli]